MRAASLQKITTVCETVHTAAGLHVVLCPHAPVAEDFMLTDLSEWKSRVEIDQRAREGRLRQEWREAPYENDWLAIPVLFWSVLGLVLKVSRAFWKRRVWDCSALSQDLTIISP